MDNSELRAIAKKIIEGSVRTYLSNKEEPKTQHVVLDRLFPVERRIRSIIGGLETSLGTTLWQPLAENLAHANGFTILDPKSFVMPVEVPVQFSAIITKWTNLRKSPKANITLDDYVQELRIAIPKLRPDNVVYTTMPIYKGEGIDLWIVKNEEEVAIDIKTVQINAGDGNKFNTTLMSWYAYRLYKDPTVKFQAKLVMPYSPFPPYDIQSWWKTMGGKAYPMLPTSDIWVQDEFWDFLTGTSNTWTTIVQVMDEIGKTGLGAEFNQLFYPKPH